jgi:cytidyltransferase-like protein
MKSIDKNVFVWGAFDILHEGHFKLFDEVNKFGKLFIIVLPDDVIAEDKKTYYTAEERQGNLLKTGCSEDVYIDALPNMHCFDITSPDVFCFGYDQSKEWTEKMKSYLRTNFPKCELMHMKEYSDVHSSELRDAMECRCNSGKRYKDCCK